MRSLRTREKPLHVTLRHPFPDHLPRVQISALAHGMAYRVSVQKLDGLLRDGIGILERNQGSPAVVQQLDGMPVRSRDNRLARAQCVRQRSRNHLRFMAIRSDIDVGGADEFGHLFRAGEAVVEDYLRLHSHFLRQSLQAGTVLIALATKNMRMGRACNDVNHVLVSGQNLRQRLDDVLNSLVRGEQSERKQNRLPFHVEFVFIEIRVEEGQVWNSVRNHVDLAARNLEYLLQELGRELAHDDQAIRQLCDLFHDRQLAGIGFA